MAQSARARALHTYWRQVRAVARTTNASTSEARAIVRSLRARDIHTAAATARHPRIVTRTLREIRTLNSLGQTRTRPASRSTSRHGATGPTSPALLTLDEWIEGWDNYDGDTDDWDIETNADY